MNGHVIVANDMGIRHIITVTDGFNAEEFVEEYYTDFHRFDSDVFIFCSGTMQQAIKIAELFSYRSRDEKK